MSKEQILHHPGYFELKSRRYIGNKHKLIDFIKTTIVKTVQDCHENITSFCDIFAGTGSVAQAFNDKTTQIIVNDMLKCNYYPLFTFFKTNTSINNRLEDKITILNQLSPSSENYFSKLYGGTYFTKHTAKKIGLIREKIEDIAKTKNEKFAMITSLIYAMDKIANTVGHYDAFRTPLDCDRPLVLKIPRFCTIDINGKNSVFNTDANLLVKNLNVDVLYIDPPYNSRQYCDTYHLLENLTEWKKPQTFGKAKKMERSHLKSKYCLRSAARTFEDLIMNANARHIFLSYNDTKTSRHSRSNAKISDKEITRILKKRGSVKIFKKQYDEFTTGKTKYTSTHYERLFYCRCSN